MAKTVTGGAELFLKGIISATVLGLIIKFLQSDYFKDFLSEENLNKLADFFKNIGIQATSKEITLVFLIFVLNLHLF